MMQFNIGKQFSPDPAGRYYTDGNSSGEQFREEVLVNLINQLKSDEKLVIVLDDGVEGYGSSFLSEAFGGLVKFGHFESSHLLKVLEYQYTDPDFEFFAERIQEYLRSAKYNSAKYTPSKARP